MRIFSRRLSLKPVLCVASVLFVAAVFGIRPAMLVAQAPAASGSGAGDATFRAGTQEVLEDAVVSDKKGNFQRDLTQHDFGIVALDRVLDLSQPAVQRAGMHVSTFHLLTN